MRKEYKTDILNGNTKVKFNIKCNDEPYVMADSICKEHNGKMGCQPMMNFICELNKNFRVNMIMMTFNKEKNYFELKFEIKCDIADDFYLENLMNTINTNKNYVPMYNEPYVEDVMEVSKEDTYDTYDHSNEGYCPDCKVDYKQDHDDSKTAHE